MNRYTFYVVTVVAIVIAGLCSCLKSNTRNYAYEEYCDSIWMNNPDYYLDVLIESDEYQNYIEINGEWWD